MYSELHLEQTVSLDNQPKIHYFKLTLTKRLITINNTKCETLHTVRGKKSRRPSPFAEQTVERTLVSSIPNTTAPLANRAILPVSKVITRDPISNSSLNDSRILVLETGGSESDGEVAVEVVKWKWPVVTG